MSSTAERLVTAEEYLAAERASETRHELVNGLVYAMAGASVAHVNIVANLIIGLRSRLRGSPCQAVSNDLRIKVEETSLYTYPDVVAYCGNLRFDDQYKDTVLNPVVLIEVLSPSTQVYDRGAKFAHYKRISSLQEYVLVAQDWALVEHFARSENGTWLLTSYETLDKAVDFPALGISVPMAEIYEGIDVQDGLQPGKADAK